MSYIRRALSYLRPYRRLAAVSLLLMVLAAAFGLLLPWPLKVLIDNVLQGDPLPAWLAGAVGGLAADRVALLGLVVIAGLVITLVFNGITVLNKAVDTRIEQRMMLDLRSSLYQHTQRLSLTYHDRKRTGRVIFAINNQGGSAAGLVMAFKPLTQNLLTLAGMFAIVASIDSRLALLSLAVVPFLYLSVGYYARRIVPEVRRVRNLEIDSLTIVHEAISMMRVVLAFGREHHEYDRFRTQGQEAVDARVAVTVKETLFSMAVNLSTALGTALVLGYGSLRALQGGLTVGQLLVVMSYLAAVYKPLEAIIHTISDLQQKKVSLESVFGLLDTEPEIRDAPDAVPLGEVAGEVTFEHTHFRYPGRSRTLADVSFRARPGELVGIVGPTGAGKSTLVALIPRFYDPSKGRILLDGRDIRSFTVGSLRRRVSLVLQEPVLFAGTIAENIRYGRLEAGTEDVIAAARAANAHDFITRLPDGYDTRVGERGARLSGGERQRLCIARAFLKDAPILILDEPTSEVDSRTETVILDALLRLAWGRTTFLIAHRLSTVRHADRILVVDGGRIVEQGTHEELLALDGLYCRLWEAQVGHMRAGAALAGGTRP